MVPRLQNMFAPRLPSWPGLTRLRGRSLFGVAKARLSISLQKCPCEVRWMPGSRLRQSYAGPLVHSAAEALAKAGGPGMTSAFVSTSRFQTHLRPLAAREAPERYEFTSLQ
jgi:hypothetical protein